MLHSSGAPESPIWTSAGTFAWEVQELSSRSLFRRYMQAKEMLALNNFLCWVKGLGTSGQLALQVLVDGPPMPLSVGLPLMCPRFWCWQVPPPLPQVGWVPTHCCCGWWGLPVSICGSEVDVPHRSLRICSYPDPFCQRRKIDTYIQSSRNNKSNLQ